MIKLVTSTQAREILSIEGKPINVRTFDKIVAAGIIEVTATLGKGWGLTVGTRFFRQEEVEVVARKMPRKRLPSRYSIVNYLKERIAKEGLDPVRTKNPTKGLNSRSKTKSER